MRRSCADGGCPRATQLDHPTRRCRYYGIDDSPGCAEWNGKPQYKKLQDAGGTFCVGMRGSQCLQWSGLSWWFKFFGAPDDGEDFPCKNRADTPQPPSSGWEHIYTDSDDEEDYLTYPTTTITPMLSDEEVYARAKATTKAHYEKRKPQIEALLASTYPHGAPANAVLKVEGGGYLKNGTCVDGCGGEARWGWLIEIGA